MKVFGVDPKEELTPLERRLKAREHAREKGRLMRMYLRASSAGLEIGLSVLVGTLGGYYLDKRFQTAPYLLYLGLLAGLVSAGRGIHRLIQSQTRFDDEEAEANASQEDGAKR